MKEILLSKGEKALVDDEDFEELNRFRWHAHFDGYNWYAKRRISRYEIVTMHSQILTAKSGYVTDHSDGDGLNNQRNNLRYSTHSQNIANSRSRGSSGGFRGVYKTSRGLGYNAVVIKDGVRHYLGYFLDNEEAARAYDKEALRLHGEFARVNFP